MATWDQDSFRFRNDDGSETTATWMAAKNVDVNVVPDQNIRVRFIIQETSGSSASGQVFWYDFRVNGGSWIPLESSGALISAETANYEHGDDSTQQIGSGTYVTDNDGMCERLPATVTGGANNDFAGNDEEETEICIQVDSASVSDGDEIEIRIVDSSFNPLDTQTNIPLMTVVLGVDVSATTDSLTLTEYAANVNAKLNVSANYESLSLSTFSAVVNVDTNVNASVDYLTMTTYQANINSSVDVSAGYESLSLTTYQSSVSSAIDVSASTESLALTTYAASLDIETCPINMSVVWVMRIK